MSEYNTSAVKHIRFPRTKYGDCIRNATAFVFLKTKQAILNKENIRFIPNIKALSPVILYDAEIAVMVP